MSTEEATALRPAVAAEIEALHRFFVDWFTGAVPAEAVLFERRFLQRFDPSFVLIPPAGTTLSLDALADAIRGTHANNAAFRIQIREVQVRVATADLVLATYEEWQKDAKASTPPNNGRAATVLFRREPDRLRWLHVHETWLPDAVMQRDSFDF